MHKERNYGIDALRIVAMFMVVLLHVLGNGGVLLSTEVFSLHHSLAWFLEISAFCAVNCYAIISGYVGYGRKIKYSNLIYLVMCVVFYIITITLTVKAVVPNISTKEVLTSFLDIFSGGYWYVKAYFCAFFFFPHINFLVEKYEEKKLYTLAGVMLILFSVIPTLVRKDVFSVINGYSPLWLMVLYFLGAVMRKYDKQAEKRKNKYLLLYLLMVVLTFMSMISISYLTKQVFGRILLQDFLISYISPTIVFAAIFLVKYFSNMNVNKFMKKIIAFMSPLTFGVYLIHTQYFIWEYLKNRFAHFADMQPLALVTSVVLTACAIFLVCIFIDYIRQCIFKVMKLDKLSKKIDGKISGIKNNVSDSIAG